MTTKLGGWSGAGDGGPPRQKTPLRWLKRLALLAVPLFCLALLGGRARAQLLDPSTLHISAAGATGSDPVNIGGASTVTVTQITDSQQATLAEPLLLILGIPEVNGTSTAPSITSVSNSGTGSLGGTNYYNGVWDTTTGFAGTMTATSTGHDGKTQGDAYNTVGVDGPTPNSQSFTNWVGNEVVSLAGVTAFDLYVYEVTPPPLPGDTISVTFGSIPLGTYVFAYDQNSDGTKAFSTAFTNTGLETQGQSVVPEPSTIALALSALVGVGFAGLRRYRRPQVAAV